MFRTLSFLLLLCTATAMVRGQSVRIDTLDQAQVPEENSKRLLWLISGGAVAYTSSSYALYQTWYRDFPQSGFHLHDDWGEWRHMDKMGHVYSSYFQTDLAEKGYRWAGLSRNKALWYAAGTSMLFQSTIEVMDGFSTEWGFSLTDMGANIVGVGSYVAQEKLWGEQRFRWKNSYSPVDYDDRLNPRVDKLYGDSFAQRWLKDYNGQTTWLSLNLDSFFSNTKLPAWLNVAIGYGAENMYGGYINDYGDGINADLQRYSQFYISLDADLSKVETSSPFVRTLLDVLNILKMPFSTIEVNTLGEIKFHLLKF